MSQFSFLASEWPVVYDAAAKAESLARGDPRGACFWSRRALELAVRWAFKHDPAMQLPYQEHLGALLHEPSFRSASGDTVFTKARIVARLGADALQSHRPVRAEAAVDALRELFHVVWWFARTYARCGTLTDPAAFDEAALPSASQAAPQTPDQLQKLEVRLHEQDEKLSILLRDKESLGEELNRLRKEVADARRANAARPDAHDYSEAETRDRFIDLLLHEAGWPLAQKRDREFEVHGMPNARGVGYVDYVLWGDDGKPLGIVEAKRTKRDKNVGQQQAKCYADCLEAAFGQRPVIFLSNGYEHRIWDDAQYGSREVQGFYTKDELQLLVQRRTSRKALAGEAIRRDIVDRHYQERAIRRIGEAFEHDNQRKALVVQATGAGKTRTVIALVELLVRCNWVKRVLFLADRVALVGQAVGAFKRHLPDASPVNLCTEKDTGGRVCVATYPTMMGLIDETKDGRRRFGVGHFDLVVIDEAHRSVFQKYRAIFDYFDSLLVGLTATPKDEVDRNTYGLFELEDGVPTDAYPLDEAVRDGFLVPMQAVSVPLKFQREGIKYDALSEAEKEQWDSLDWDEVGDVPDRVDADAVNKWLFNRDTVDKVLEHLMTRGQKVAGGNRLGKTIVFAKNNDHAVFIAQRFDANYPHLKGAFARVVTYKTEYAETLIAGFAAKDKDPHIAISVDMLDTGIDVPEILNLVFFKRVYSKTKFWQMIGRGTRLCPDLFGPGADKRFFYVLDYCGNLEFFGTNPEMTDGAAGDSLGKRLFKTRLELVGALDEATHDELPMKARDAKGRAGLHPREVRQSIAEHLRAEVAAMNPDNFVVRNKRRFVEKYREHSAWLKPTRADLHEAAEEVAGLPSELPSEPEESLRFDLLVLRAQLGLTTDPHGIGRPAEQVKEIARLLEEKVAIPMVRAEILVIQAVQTDEWWQDATVGMLEHVRRRLRLLVPLIDKRARRVVYSDFEDELGPDVIVTLPAAGRGDDLTLYRQ